ncbi:MAG: M28 family peptidase [Oscillospiraceae bacterium]|nr:M28 family peptidase [Oscillospiraceae bacterium]
MEGIDSLKKYLLTVHPVRKTGAQKREFRQWLLRELKRAGWKAGEETYGKWNGSVNVVAGDPDRADIFLCAHYDTGSRMLVPDFVSPANVLAHICYHLAAALALAAAAFLLALAVSFPLDQPGLMLPLFLVLAVAALWLAAYGPANQSNANGNSSGVLALMAAAREVRPGKRVCLVFLDNNERSLLGASAFKKRHIDKASQCLFIDLDCVGDGEELLLIPSKYSRWDGALLEALESSFPEGEEMRPHVLAKGLQYYPSDNRKFKFHVTVCACRYLSGLGYYIPHLRTKRDTVLREENAAYIARSIARFLPAYLDGGTEE